MTDKVRKSVYEEPDREVTMASRVWVGGKGEGYFEVELTFENMKLEDKHVQNQLVVTMLYKLRIHSAVSIGLKIWMLAQNGFRKACFHWQSLCMKVIKDFLPEDKP